MKTRKFNSLNREFREAYIKARNERNFDGRKVLVVIKDIIDQTKSKFPFLKITRKHVSYYSATTGYKVITDMNVDCKLILE